jgi:uncharacterized protein YggU (UPF0235/DUF167 family)
MRLVVRVTPRAARDAVAGFNESGVLQVRVTAAPVGGAANAAVTKLLARHLALPPREIVLVHGATGRDKHFDIPLDEQSVHARLGR